MKLLYIFAISLLLYTASCKPLDDGDYEDDMQKDDYDEYEDSLDDQDEDDEDIPMIVTKPQRFTIRQGENVTLPCNIEGNADTYVIMWKKYGSIIYQDKHILGNFSSHKFQLVNRSLLIKNVDENDEGEYTCEVIMPHDPPTVTHKVFIESPAKIVSLSADKNVNEYKVGDTLILTCNVTGVPEPKIIWSFKGDRFDSSGNRLIIENIKPHHNGIYQCLAENQIGKPAHQIISVKVMHKPIVSIEKFTTNIHQNSYDVELRCAVHSNPYPIVRWIKDDDESTKITHTKARNKNDVHSLIFNNVKNEDFGLYKCVAENQIGKTEQTILFTNAPSKPVFIDHKTTRNNATFEYDIESMYPISEYTLEYRKENDSEWMEEKPSVTNSDTTIYKLVYTLTNLHPGVYQVKVKAKNENGWSEESTIKSFKMNSHKTHHDHKKQHKTYDRADENAVAHETRLEDGTASSSIAISSSLSLICLALLTLLRH